jgi:hypothetical protein
MIMKLYCLRGGVCVTRNSMTRWVVDGMTEEGRRAEG